MNDVLAGLSSDELLNSLYSEEDGADARSALKTIRGEVLTCDSYIELDAQDFFALALASSYNTAQPLKKLRASHHELAQLLAIGKTREECTLLTHYSLSRIHVLMLDPLFVELVESYRRSGQQANTNVQGQLLNIALDSLQTFAERLEERPNEISDKDLISVAKLGLDRSGFGPTTKNLNLNLNAELTPEKLAELHQRAQSNARATVEIVASRVQPEELPPIVEIEDGRANREHQGSEDAAGRLLAPDDPEA